MGPFEIAAIILLAAAGATVQGSTGLGFTLVAGAGLVAIDPGFVPGPMLVAAQVVGVRHMVAEHDHADLAAVKNCLWGLPFGLVAGLVVLEWLSERGLGLLVGGLTALAAATLLAGASVRRTRRVEVVVGAATTFSSVTAALPGPPLVVAFADMKPATMRSTISMFISVIATFGFCSLWLAGKFGAHELRLLLLLLPGTVAGLLIAGLVRPYLERPWFRPLVLTISLLGGLGLVVRHL